MYEDKARTAREILGTQLSYQNNPEMLANRVECEPQRESRHIALDQAIERLNTINSRLTDLRDRITGMDCDAKTQIQAARPASSLAGLLDDGPSRIYEKIELAHAQLNEIENLLF